MNVAPGRFSDKTEKEKKVIGVRWPASMVGGTATNPQWTSEPPGLAFINPVDAGQPPAMTGEWAYVRVEQGARGQTYRVRHGVTIQETGEYLEVTHNGQPGVTLQVTGHGRSGDDYRWSHRFHAYGG